MWSYKTVKFNAGLYGCSITSRHIKLKSNRDNVTYQSHSDIQHIWVPVYLFSFDSSELECSFSLCIFATRAEVRGWVS